MEVVSCLQRIRYWLECIGMANPGAGYSGFEAEDRPILFKWKKNHGFNLPGSEALKCYHYERKY